MERTITGTVGEVQGRTVNTKYGEKTVFDITIGSQKTSTFKSDIAEEANALKGSTVDATVREEQRGDYTNYMLLGVKLADYGATEHSSSTSTIPVTTAPESNDSRQTSIEKQTSLKVAAAVHSGSGADAYEVISYAEKVFDWLQGKKNALPTPVAAAAAAETTEEVPW